MFWSRRLAGQADPARSRTSRSLTRSCLLLRRLQYIELDLEHLQNLFAELKIAFSFCLWSLLTHSRPKARIDPPAAILLKSQLNCLALSKLTAVRSLSFYHPFGCSAASAQLTTKVSRLLMHLWHFSFAASTNSPVRWSFARLSCLKDYRLRSVAYLDEPWPCSWFGRFSLVSFEYAFYCTEDPLPPGSLLCFI